MESITVSKIEGRAERDAAGHSAGKETSRAVSMEIAFVITLPIKAVLGLWSCSIETLDSA